MNFSWIVGMVFSLCLLLSTAAEAAQSIPENVYQWVQSTARQNYYFNKQQIYYLGKADGTMDLNRIEVATLRTYDPVQIKDILSKRRWKGLSNSRYNDLAAGADYIEVNLKDHTIAVNEHQDLDSLWGVIGTNKEPIIINVDVMADNSVERKFFESIIEYTAKHQAEIIAHTESEKKLTLSAADKKALDKANNLAEKEEKKKAGKKK